MEEQSYIVQVAVPRPLRKPLTYRPLAATTTLPGQRVRVPLGASHSIAITLTIASQDTRTDNNYVIKPLLEIIDEQPLLDTTTLHFIQWAARYYHHPVGEVVFASLPKALRDGKPLPITRYWQAIPNDDSANQLKRAPRQLALYQYLSTATSEANIREKTGNGWQTHLRNLEKKGLVNSVDAPTSTPNTAVERPTLTLTSAQQDCLQQIQTWFTTPQDNLYKPVLLHGITGSGKTEIYLRLIEPILHAGKQVLVLVPEISLTPQLVQRFRYYFHEQTIACLHSGLSDGERLNAWTDARNGTAHIIIGTRSAVFVPAPKLGAILIDEEHDTSLKQQEGFRYHARDLAIKRAHMLSIPILLGSATPALESLHNHQQERYHYYYLGERPGRAVKPATHLLNIRGQHLQAGLSTHAMEKIRETLDRNEQVMIFLNRRGFAPVLMCGSCGWTAECQHCSSNMTYHARLSRLICHHCGHEQTAPHACPDCQNTQLQTQGHGTERLELTLTKQFSETPVVRIDRDTTSRKGSLQQHLDTIRSHDRLILIGTQMLAKGHDFPNLTLVIIVDVDSALLSAEYHALERLGQLLVQVSGRAGRSEKPGTVLLQTTQPEHPTLLHLLQHGYTAFARQLLEERKRWRFPPYGYQAMVRANAADLNRTLGYLSIFREHLSAHFQDVTIMGPSPAPMEKRAGRYRAQLLLHSKKRARLHQALDYLVEQETSIKKKSGIRWSIDIDPVELT